MSSEGRGPSRAVVYAGVGVVIVAVILAWWVMGEPGPGVVGGGEPSAAAPADEPAPTPPAAKPDRPANPNARTPPK